MQKVLTLQFSCTGIGDTGRNSGQSLARRSSKRVAMHGEREREVPWSLRLCTLMICSFKHCRLSLQVCCTLHKSLSNGDIFWDNLCLVDQWLGRKVLEKSFYDVQRFAEEGKGRGVLRCAAVHRTPKTFAQGRPRRARGKEHSRSGQARN